MEKEILTKLYQTTKERSTTEEYDNIRNAFSELKEQFLGKVGENQREELERITDILNELNDITSKEDFCNGFSMAVKLFVECIYNKEDN